MILDVKSLLGYSSAQGTSCLLFRAPLARRFLSFPSLIRGMQLFTTVDLPQNLNATHIQYVHTHLEFNSWHLDSLESRYDRLSNLLIDVVIETASVGAYL